MISTAATVEAAVRAALGAGAKPDVTVVATHAVFAGPSLERLAALPIARCIVTDSIGSVGGAAQAAAPTARTSELDWLEVISIAPLLADAVTRLHEGRSLADPIAHGV